MSTTSYNLRLCHKVISPEQFLIDFLSVIITSDEINTYTRGDGEKTTVHVSTDYGDINLDYSHASKPDIQYPHYGMHIKTHIRFMESKPHRLPKGLRYKNGREAWELCVANYFDTSFEDAIEDNQIERIVRKSGILYSGRYWYGDNQFNKLLKNKVQMSVQDLPMWMPEYYVGHSHQILVATNIATLDDILSFLLQKSTRSITQDNVFSTPDITAIMSTASKITLRQLATNPYTLDRYVTPTHIIEVTPLSSSGFQQLLRVINFLLAKQIEFVFAWQHIPLLMQKDNKVTKLDGNGEFDSFQERYKDILNFEID